MKKSLPFVAVIVVVAVIVGIAVANKSDNNTNTNPNPAPPASNNTATPNPSPQSSSANSISIVSMSFSPSELTVKKGTTVTWKNDDSTTHTITADSDTEHGPNSGSVNPGQSYTFTFKDAGTFAYHCEIHPSMTGTVKVTD